MRRRRLASWLLGCVPLASLGTSAQSHAPQDVSELHLRIVPARTGRHSPVPAVVWLEPTPGTPAAPLLPQDHYTLLQKNRTFIPHLLVIPVGAVVQFPNADPFFHNVFSLFDGKRFDLGLYEAGSSKGVSFPRKGVSYIFCNIHPEMSAVVVALSTRLYAIADPYGSVVLRDVPAGNYRLHLWIEGVPQSALESLSQPLQLSGQVIDLGTVTAPANPPDAPRHTNKFGKPYDPESKPDYPR